MVYGDTMFKVYKAKGIVRVPPEYFGKAEINDIASKVLREQYEGYIDPAIGLVITIYDVKASEEGVVIHGDGATYHEVEFKILAFAPKEREIIEGEVVSVKNFGLFVNIGPLDALVHKSQIADEPLDYDAAREVFIGKNTRRVIGRGDIIRGMITAVSMQVASRQPKIALTMRQPFLGKIEWIKREIESLRKSKEE